MDVRWLGLNRHFLLLSRFEKLGARAASNVVVYPEQGLSYGGLSVDRKRGNQHSEYLSLFSCRRTWPPGKMTRKWLIPRLLAMAKDLPQSSGERSLAN
jgi:hypothetical protein